MGEHPAASARLIRFGPYEFDSHTRELRRNGFKLKLAGQPIEVLAILLERPGELVTREELQSRLWPNDTVVEFEHSINTAVKRVREVLEDSAGEPRFVETLPRRGYRFIAPVEPVAAVSPPVDQAAAVRQLPPLPTTDAEMTGQMVGRFRVLEKLGGGGMGVVYRAEDTKLGRAVAIKFLPAELSSDRRALDRFEREARAASALDHPNICGIYDTGEHAGQPFLVMPLLKGQTLKQRIGAAAGESRQAGGDGKSPLQADEMLDLAVQIAEGLAAAHSQGIIHRDIKPTNVFVTDSGQVKILDFGLAKLVHQREESVSPEQHAMVPGSASGNIEDSITKTGVAVGTPAYMSPEQVRGEELDTRADLFSFGATLYEMATGIQPFAGKTPEEVEQAILTRSVTSLRELNHHLPPKLESIIARALEKDRKLRYQSATNLIDDLVAVREGLAPAQGHLRGTPPRKRWKVLVPAALMLVAAAIGGAMHFGSRQPPVPLTDKDTIVLSDFINKTGDSVFDDTLKQGLSVQLEQSPFLALVSERRVNETLKLMGRPAGDRLTPEVTREVCQRTSSKAMLAGSIAGMGSQYVIGLKAVDCNTGDELAEAQEQAAGKEAVLKALDAAAVSLRSKLGESLSSVQKYDAPVEEVTTPSLEALKAYSLGLRTNSAKGPAAALPFFKRAVELDPNFATAYAGLSILYWDLDQFGRGAENARKAYDLREKVSERERFSIEGRYYMIATGEMEKAAQTYELWQQTYPRDTQPYRSLGIIFAFTGNWEKALEEWRPVLRQEPNEPYIYHNLGHAYLALNRLDEAEAVYKQAQERKLETESVLQLGYWLAFLRGDTAQMAQLVSAGMGKPGAEDLLLGMQADTEAWFGKLKNAHELTVRAMDSAQQNNSKDAAARYQAFAALREAEAGNREQARAEAHAALKLPSNRWVRTMAALALARAGDSAESERLTAEIDKTFPLDTVVQRDWLPTIRAGIALARQDPSRAIELLRPGDPIKFGSTMDLTTCMCTPNLRGDAYLMLHDGNAAATEFQKFIDHRTRVVNFPLGALARLGLARVYALQGNTAKARAAYKDFLTLWKDADPDVPILKQAKAEYAKLK
jgi:serine/threonine protein kinase/DNA-binding winged helix-turn-helix (wHTH) protein/tetratricopeptide (TPR) repeat protein